MGFAFRGKKPNKINVCQNQSFALLEVYGTEERGPGM